MFTFEKKEYDEKKLEGKGKIAFDNITIIQKTKDDLLHKLEQQRILETHYTEVLKANLYGDSRNNNSIALTHGLVYDLKTDKFIPIKK